MRAVFDFDPKQMNYKETIELEHILKSQNQENKRDQIEPNGVSEKEKLDRLEIGKYGALLHDKQSYSENEKPTIIATGYSIPDIIPESGDIDDPFDELETVRREYEVELYKAALTIRRGDKFETIPQANIG